MRGTQEPLDELAARIAALEAEHAALVEQTSALREALEKVPEQQPALVARYERRRRVRGALMAFATVALGCAAVGAYAVARAGPDAAYAGTVRAVEGPAPADVGDACTVTVTPRYTDSNCRVVVSCGGRDLFGAATDVALGLGVGAQPRHPTPTLATTCTSAAGSLERAVSEPGTPSYPRLSLEPARRTATLTSSAPAWRIEIALAPEAD
ncbi:MAG: hypothetical protein KF729_32730 [Sandaracinaceae bacterium]|nr:hypothetical protein [Sandaracinaceae bacterium]